MIGIYKITNRINQKSYIGQSVDISRRWAEHRILTRDETLSLKRAFKKYGIENFDFDVLELCSEEKLDEREIYYISLCKPEYNRTAGGKGCLEHRQTEETKKVLSEKSKSQWERKTEEEKRLFAKNNLKGPRKGHSVSEATREKLRAANLGKKQSIETVEKRRQSIAKSGRVRTNEKCKKSVYCYELDTTYESVKAAAEAVNVTPSVISAHLKKRYKSVKGYHFSYVV